MAATTYLTDLVIDFAFTGKTTMTIPTVYIGLSSTTPVVAGTGVTEPSTGSYARVATSGSTWTAAATGATSNSSAITFATATADWASAANMTYAVAYDASTAGHLLWFALLSTAKNVLNGDTASIGSAQLTITIS